MVVRLGRFEADPNLTAILETQHRSGQSNFAQATSAKPYVPQHILQALEYRRPNNHHQEQDREQIIPYNNPPGNWNLFENRYGGGANPETIGRQGQDVLDGVEYNLYLIEEDRQGTLHQGMNEAWIRQNMVQTGGTANMQPGNPSTNHDESPSVQQAESFVETSGIPKRGWNTLGPGGRKVHQAPEQVLGKRGQAQQQDSDSGHSSVLNGTQQLNNRSKPSSRLLQSLQMKTHGANVDRTTQLQARSLGQSPVADVEKVFNLSVMAQGVRRNRCHQRWFLRPIPSLRSISWRTQRAVQCRPRNCLEVCRMFSTSTGAKMGVNGYSLEDTIGVGFCQLSTSSAV